MDDPRVGTVVDGRYEIHERLAAGGMGVVYRGERVGLAKPVAIKFLHRTAAMMPERIARFRREATAMSRLAHPNLMSIIDFGEVEGVPYLVMEFAPGASLREALEDGAIDARRAVFIAYQILAGLGSAHASGVLHRDLKPANVLLVGAPGEDLVKILDFGIAKLLDTGTGPTEVSVVAGRVLGTPQYMAPEQARSQTVDPRTDIYAVGIILYEMVVGRRPFDGENDLAVLRQQVEDKPVPARAIRPEISAELDAVISRALAKKPEERWTSAQEFSNALLELPEGSSVLRLRSATTDGISQQYEEEEDDDDHEATPHRRRGGRVFFLLLALLVVAGGVVFAASHFGYITGMPWQAAVPPDAAPDAAPPDANLADATPPDAAPPPIRAELQPYVDFLRQQRRAPVDYLLGLFEHHDVVALCLRESGETTQYELVDRLLRDHRFAKAGRELITETGPRALRSYIADLVHGPAISDEQLLHVYRRLEEARPNTTYGELLKSVQAINAKLPPEKQIQVVPAHDRLAETVGDLDDDASALVLLHDCRQKLPSGAALVLLDQLGATGALAGGRWDAAFERSGNRPAGFDLAGSPFGADEVGPDRDAPAGTTYGELFTGFLFYKPLSAHRLVYGVPGLLDDDLTSALAALQAVTDQPPLSDGTEHDRAQTYAAADPTRWSNAQRQIEGWLQPAPQNHDDHADEPDASP